MARPKSTDEQRTNRNIRMNDFEWSVFRDHMGAEWLRAQIAKVAKAKKIQPTETGE
jgi:hypothetical protein